MYSEKTQRRTRMIAQAMSSIAIAGLGIWFAWVEFGERIFSEPIFWFLVFIWGYLNMTLFFVKWGEAAEKTSDEKIDELITEIKAGKEQRDKEWVLLIKELKRRKK